MLSLSDNNKSGVIEAFTQIQDPDGLLDTRPVSCLFEYI